MKKHLVPIIVFILGFLAVVPLPAQTLKLSLRVNQQFSDTIYRDEPVLFDVSLTSMLSEADKQWNIEVERTLEKLRMKRDSGLVTKDEYEQEAARVRNTIRKPDVTTLGSFEDPWTGLVNWRITDSVITYELKWPIIMLKHPPVRAAAILDGSAYYSASFGIPPEQWSAIPPGLYAVEFYINSVYSNAVIVEVIDSLLPVSVSRNEAILLRWGRYYWHAADGAKVIQYAEQLLAIDPASPDALTLRGDGEVLRQYYLPALETYNKAVKEYQKKYGPTAEPPSYLLSMIRWLKRELGDPVINQ